MAAERFAANEHAAANRQKRGGGIVLGPLEEEVVSDESPEAVYEREWRRQLFGLAVADLRRLCEERDQRIHFAIFESYDLSDPRPSYGELAARHGIAETAVTNHLAWARRTLRMLVIDRVRELTGSERELREEMRRLWT